MATATSAYLLTGSEVGGSDIYTISYSLVKVKKHQEYPVSSNKESANIKNMLNAIWSVYEPWCNPIWVLKKAKSHILPN